jgi:1-acyl-sn-glycerol-3-phosphate acyltransferase
MPVTHPAPGRHAPTKQRWQTGGMDSVPRLPCRLRDAWTAELPHASGVVRLLLRGLVTCFGPLASVEGEERLAGLPEPAIFALNHSSTFECFAAPAALLWLRRGRMIHFLIDWMYLHLPGIGWLMRQSDPVPVYGKPARWRLGERHRRERLRRPVLEACLERLAEGGSLGIFPEGTRNRDAGLLRGRPGLGEVVLRSTAPVVPVGLRFPAAERLGRPPRLGRIVLAIGEPLDFREERSAEELSASARRALARQIVTQVMSEIARLSGKSFPALGAEGRAA